MKKRFVSLASRNALVYFFLFVMGLALSSFLFFYYSSREILQENEKRLKHTEEMIQLKFGTYLDQLERDLNQLSYSPLLENYVNVPDTVNLDLLTKEYRSFLKTKSNYFQTRLIAGDESGMEIIRVERQTGEIVNCPTNELQFKGNRDYFVEMSALPKDSLYVSKIDLNKEYGEITDPQVPTLRIGKKMGGDSLKNIMLLVNVDLRGVFAELNELLPHKYELKIFNDNGHYLIHPDDGANFTFEYGKEGLYSTEHDELIENISSDGKTVSDEEAVNYFFQLDYPRSGYDLFGVVSARKKAIFASFYSWRNKILAVTIGIAIVFLLLAFIYMRRQVKELKRITTGLTQFSRKMEPNKMTINRNDEIGELAKSFELMSGEIYESHLEVAKAKDEAEKAYQEKNEFLENMSHEIRNPLQSILGITSILEQNESALHQQPFIDSLKFSAVQLNSLVTDVLDYGKIKKGQIKLNKEWNDLEVFCQDLITASAYQANKKSIVVAFNYADELKSHLFKFDPVRMYQVLNNLLNNALKFTPNKGEVSMTIDFSNEVVSFLIKDSGTGIPEEDLNKILNRNVASDYTTGSGLGLTIVQELLRLDNSELIIESKKGESRFSFVLEMERKMKESSEIPLTKTKVSLGEKSDLKIMVIEDDLELMNWYNYILEGISTSNFTDIEKIKGGKGEYDLVISDLNFGENKIAVNDLEEKINPFLKSNGRLIIISGTEKTVDNKTSIMLQKPVKKEAVYDQIIDYQLALKHGVPNFTNLEIDYDRNNKLIVNALNVLIREWEKDRLTLETAVLNKDQKKFNAVKHRIITSVRRLEIDSFEVFLNGIYMEDTQINHDGVAQELNEKFQFYIRKMRDYIQ